MLHTLNIHHQLVLSEFKQSRRPYDVELFKTSLIALQHCSTRGRTHLSPPREEDDRMKQRGKLYEDGSEGLKALVYFLPAFSGGPYLWGFSARFHATTSPFVAKYLVRRSRRRPTLL